MKNIKGICRGYDGAHEFRFNYIHERYNSAQYIFLDWGNNPRVDFHKYSVAIRNNFFQRLLKNV